LGVSYGTNTEWKLYGPDLNGVYGRLNGVGGLDAVSPGGSLFNSTISDARGNILGYYDSSLGSVTLNSSRPTGFGAVSGYRPVALANGANVAQASAWQGHWSDVSGYYGIGARTYDPVSGRWLSFDPIWNVADPNGYTFTGGDPINYFDPSGMCIEAGWNGSKYYGGMAVSTVVGMAEDANTVAAMGNPSHPQYLQVHMQMARQGMVDYVNGDQGWKGTRNVINRYNPLRSPFEAVSGEHLMEGSQLGDRLTGAERATQWASTISLTASLGTGAPGTLSAISADLRTLSSFSSLPRTLASGGIKNVTIPGGLPNGVRVIRSGETWHVLEYPNGTQTIRFKASDAMSPNTAKMGGYSGTPETLAKVNPATGKVYVSEGQHRLNAVALEGKTVSESVPQADGWLEYEFGGETTHVGNPPAFNPGVPYRNPYADNGWDGQDGY